MKSVKKNNQNVREVIAFWRPFDPYPYLGQWCVSNFNLTDDIVKTFPDEIKNLQLYRERYDVIEKLIEQQNFNTAEKFMMMGKAALFRDNRIFRQMSLVDDPKNHKALGQRVANFDQLTWDMYCEDIVKLGNYLKFSQDELLKRHLKNTGNAILVEGSPLDRIWGVGLKFDDPNIRDKSKWRGQNLLGSCLEFVRNLI